MNRDLRLGIDVGSTTVKLAVVDAATGALQHSVYERHHARQAETTLALLQKEAALFPEAVLRAAVCGSGGRPLAEALGVPYIQEVVANAAAVCAMHPEARTAIELGGQDAKVIFFYFDEKKGVLQTSDMRMNGSCAGGTGAFIDEIASLLDIKPEDYEAMAAAGTYVYDISGRCGVFAKTDIQPLLLQGAAREDIALSAFHAIAKQTIGGLSQGLALKAPIIFEGGPLHFHPTLVRVFAERLGLSDDEIIIPEHPETIVAAGTAIAIDKLFPEKSETRNRWTIAELCEQLANKRRQQGETAVETEKPLFASAEARRKFEARHHAERRKTETPKSKNGVVRAYLGIDSGSTTSKMVLLDEEERVINSFYAGNQGRPLDVVCEGIKGFYETYRQLGLRLEIIGAGTTGYGERMLAKAFGADLHIVETVAHAAGCIKYIPDASFVLDIGGQDMKAIRLEDGVITNIMLNEACSSGCGSFLETFAAGLGIPAEQIAETAFSSQNPARLGSRCTVFMNSTIINEQRRGKKPEDIMAGLCRSIIENVFTKVVRIANADALGSRIVVQGGTFKNEAVLRALEEYLGRDVILAPYSGEMGALGAALLTKAHLEEAASDDGENSGAQQSAASLAGENSGAQQYGAPRAFIGEQGIAQFHYTTRTGIRCDGCANHCSRTVVSFSNGRQWITGNRCERGELLEESEASESAAKAGKAAAAKRRDKKQESVRAAGAETAASAEKGEDLFAERERGLFALYPCQSARERGETVGLPRVLEFWDSMPFWSTFFRALGYGVKFSNKSSRRMYEEGLEYVASDTICFPAKLVHGHILDLERQGVDRIFMPYIMHMPPEGRDKQSPYVCAVVQGYPMVIKNAQDPEGHADTVFDTPVFHWFTEKDRKRQIIRYATETLSATAAEAAEAFAQAEAALLTFRRMLTKRAAEIINRARAQQRFVVVLAGRPYHTDPLVSHDISKLFTKNGISVLPVDSLPDLSEKELKHTTIEITNNFHTRMLEGAMAAAEEEALEYVQLVSFGCGHDAVLSDEIVRIMTERANKPPLILKIDESDAAGSLGIRVQSFVETVRLRRKGETQQRTVLPLPAPSPVKFYKADKKRRTLLIPNISKEISVILDGILDKEQFTVKTVPVGGLAQIALGKKYVHNDICFPCQMVIGELISALQEGAYAQDAVAVGMVKFQCDCRMSHYAGLLRKGLDAAGFAQVPVVTTDMGDSKDMHPGVALLGVSAVLEAVWSFEMLDILTELCRKIRPYERKAGETDRVYQACVQKIADGIRVGISCARKAFAECIADMEDIQYDRSHLKPRVFVTGELLVTYHPGSNFQIERYLESNGMEAVFPRVTDQLRKDFRASECEIKGYHANIPPYPFAVSWLFDEVQKKLEAVAVRHPLYVREMRPREMYRGVEDIIPETLSCGEGWLMAAEIDHYAREGVASFVILQPFGCLPNHICGRGTIKRLKERYPNIQILPLDLDPDTSYANVENRLQMLIMNA